MFWKKRIYLDAAAGVSGNPSSPHEEGRRAKRVLEEARTTVARLAEVKTDDIVFASGATEANAIAILGLARPGMHFLYLPSAHASIVENMKIAEARGVVLEPLPIKNGRVDIEALRGLVRPETALVSMEAVCGETGTIWNTREVATLLAKNVSAPLLHVDASQAPYTEKISRAHFSADMLTLDGAKLGVPGAGCLVAHRTIELAPIYGGGGQERGLRSGTENVETIARFAKALLDTSTKREVFLARARSARTNLLKSITGIPNLYINEGAKSVPHILSLSLPGRDTDYLAVLLDEAGFAVATRSACETNSEQGSRAVFALTGDLERAKSTLRISWSHHLQSREFVKFARALERAVLFIDTTGQG